MAVDRQVPRSEHPERKVSGKAFAKRLKAWFARPRLALNALLLAAFFAAWIRDVLYWFPRDAFGNSLNYWAYTDWLIDYSQGFIRRGLSGEIWRLVPAGTPHMEFVAALSWVLILIAAFGYVRLLARNWKAIHPLTLFGLLFLPSLFLFYLHDHNGIARKEILGYATVLLHLLAVERALPLRNGGAAPEGNLRRYLLWMVPVAGILLPAIILVHEGNFLLFVPLHAMITLSVLRMKPGRTFLRAALWTGLLYLPAALAFGLVYLSGTPGYPQLLAICEKWSAAKALYGRSCYMPPEKLSGSTLPGSFIPMQWTLGKAFYITRVIISMQWKAWVVVLPVLGISLWYLVRQALFSILRARFPQSFLPRVARRYTGIFFRKFMLVPLLCALPLFLTAYDYGRWFTVVCINYAMLAVSANLPCREYARREAAAVEDRPAAGAPDHLDKRWVFYGVSAAICLLAVVLWLPHYCLFKCEIVRSPLLFFSHAFVAR